MPDDIFLPHPIGNLYRNINSGLEAVLLYDKGYMFDPRPDADNMIPSVTYMDDDYDFITYPKQLWEEEFEVVPVSLNLLEEDEA